MSWKAAALNGTASSPRISKSMRDHRDAVIKQGQEENARALQTEKYPGRKVAPLLRNWRNVASSLHLYLKKSKFRFEFKKSQRNSEKLVIWKGRKKPDIQSIRKRLKGWFVQCLPVITQGRQLTNDFLATKDRVRSNGWKTSTQTYITHYKKN